ncbi:MAG: esterase [Cyclobacteriaceae bacterium]|nr:MAG: esterase [Cyclobacteriaceae bacterium]
MEQALNHLSIGHGLPVVFQHGLTANIKQTESLLAGLRNIRLLSIDCPGHGTSPLSDDYLVSFNRYADEVLRFIDRHQIEQAVFGGISMGSGIAINIALRYPDRVKGLILVRPAWLDYKMPRNLQILLPAAQLMNQENGKRRFQELPEFKSIQRSSVAKSILGVFAPEQQAALSQVIERMVNDQPFSKMEELKRISLPCLVLCNEDDPLHPIEMAEIIHQTIPGSVLRKVTSRYIDNDLHRTQVRNSIQEFIQKNNLT